MLKRVLRNQKGVSLILLALSIVVLFGFGAVAIDIGHLYNVKNQLQAAADAAALAGAAALECDSTDLDPNCKARQEAFKIAARNLADVAYLDVPGNPNGPTGPGGMMTTPDVAAGEAIPVSLRHEQGQDIDVGHWDSSTGFSPGASPINAVRVYAHRDDYDDSRPFQPRVQNWFAKIFKLMGADYDLSSITAVAIAAKVGEAPLLPIAVNEYWGARKENDQVYGTDQDYPNSFVRQINVDGSNSTMVRNTFAILGEHANDNVPSGGGGGQAKLQNPIRIMLAALFGASEAIAAPGGGSQNVNGFIYMDIRTNLHDGTGSWYDVPENATCSPCNLTSRTAPTEGNVSNQQSDFRQFLYNGYPRVPPSAVDEIPLDISGGKQYPQDSPTLPPYTSQSTCPYATVTAFSSSGNELTVSFNGQSFYDKFKEGDKFVVMVYDGSFDTKSSVANVVTIVGYSLIEIDGYDSGSPKSVNLQTYSADNTYSLNKTALGDSGNTAYGHVLPHEIPGTADPYILQRKDAISDCDLVSKIEDIKKKAISNTTVRLVDPNLRYGLVDHQ